VSQIVRVSIGGQSHELTYHWDGSEELSVGDPVVVPPPWWANDTSEMRDRYSHGVVTGLGSDYTGPTVGIRSRGR
jgi:hypothetical protein